jgi:hypothetical protein
MNCGSLDSLNVSVRCGLSPNARQIRRTLVGDIPVWRAISRVDQWVASVGVSSKVLTTTRSTCSSVIVRGAPGRGSSTNPSSRWATKRARHLVTVGRERPSRSATSVLEVPSAQASTIRQRSASAWALLRRRDHRSSVARSSVDSTSGASLGPRRRVGFGDASIPRTYQTANAIAAQDTRHDRRLK